MPEPRHVPTLRAARHWLSRSAGTWCGALLPTEDGFTGFVLDDDGSEALVLEYGRDPDLEPIEHDREGLRLMKVARRRTTTKTTKTTKTTEGETP